MRRHGLTNDLKKLDSFNQFIEKHSPKQSRQNSCSYIGDTLGEGGSYDSFRAPYIQNAKFKRAGSGELIQSAQGGNLNISNFNFQNVSNSPAPEEKAQDQTQINNPNSSTTAINNNGFQFPF